MKPNQKKELTIKFLNQLKEDPQKKKIWIDIIVILFLLDEFLDDHTPINLNSVFDFDLLNSEVEAFEASQVKSITKSERITPAP
jgi:hypothetical protein